MREYWIVRRADGKCWDSAMWLEVGSQLPTRKAATTVYRRCRELGHDCRIIHVRRISAERRRRERAVIEAATTYRKVIGTAAIVDAIDSLIAAVAALET